MQEQEHEDGEPRTPRIPPATFLMLMLLLMLPLKLDAEPSTLVPGPP